jgi:hypothetical protein
MICSLFVGLVRINVLFYICSMQNAYNPKPDDDAGDSGGGSEDDDDDDEF